MSQAFGPISWSGDGRFLTFWAGSDGPDFPAFPSNGYELFLHDRVTGATTWISRRFDGAPPFAGGGMLESAKLSADGRFVVFSSIASNLVPADMSDGPFVLLHDRETRQTVRLDVPLDGSPPVGSDFLVPFEISADGRFVGFASTADNLVPGDTNGREDVFVAGNCLAAPVAPSTATINWVTPPAASAVGGAAMPLSWELRNFIGPITANQAHYGIRSVLKSSPEQPGTNGIHSHTFAAPNVGTFDAPVTYKFAAAAQDNGTLVVSPIASSSISAGPAPPTVQWITPPPPAAESGGSFTVSWQVSNFVDPPFTNSVGWGITSLLGFTPRQPGGNGVYTATVPVPVVSSEGTLSYTAFAQNPIEFAFAPIAPVAITLGPPPGNFAAADLFPTAAGSAWTYRDPFGAQQTTTVQPGLVDINGTPTTEFRRTDGRARFWTNDAQGIRFHEERIPATGLTGTYTPPFQVTAATVTLGQTVTTTGTITVIQTGQPDVVLPYTSTFTAEALENVTVPAGTFLAVRIHGTIAFTGGGTRIVTSWAVPGVGVVHEVDSIDGTRSLVSSTLLP